MHDNSLAMMDTMLDRYKGVHPYIRDYTHTLMVLDVGSYDINGTYRPLIERRRGWFYVGLDVRPGPNVDLVTNDPYRYPIADGTYDVVMFGNALHNTQAFWLVIPEIKRVTKSSGLIAIVAPTWNKPESGKYPVDCWRVMPDGMQFLLGDLLHVQVETSLTDIGGSGFKP